jgi:hypothetical protein
MTIPFRSTPHGRLRLAGIVVLVVGLLAALCVYLVAANGPGGADAAGYRIVNGQAYPVALDDASNELRELERLGGKAASQTYRFNHWLGSLWHGERLAYTLAVLSVALSLMCFYIAGLMAEDVAP